MSSNSPAQIKHPLLGLMNRITQEAFDEYWKRDEDGTVATIPHLSRALPALGKVNAEYREGQKLLDYLIALLQEGDGLV